MSSKTAAHPEKTRSQRLKLLNIWIFFNMSNILKPVPDSLTITIEQNIRFQGGGGGSQWNGLFLIFSEGV